MRKLLSLLLIVGSFLPLTAEDWTTLDGKTYKNVTNIQQADDGVTITYTGGTAKIPLYNLPLDIQKQLGQDLDTPDAKKKAADESAAAAKALAAATQKRLDDERARQALEAARARALVEARKADHLPPLPGMFPATATTGKSPIAGAEYNYDHTNNSSYLDSAPANITSPGSTLATLRSWINLRTISQGTNPEGSDKVYITLFFNGAVPKGTDKNNVTVIADGTSIPVNDADFKIYDGLPGGGQPVAYLSFSVPTDVANKIFSSKSVQIKAGGASYGVDASGLSVLQQFLKGLEKLPPQPSYFVQKYRQFMFDLPSWPVLISQTCIYIILCAALLLAFFCLSAIWLGISRFMRM